MVSLPILVFLLLVKYNPADHLCEAQLKTQEELIFRIKSVEVKKCRHWCILESLALGRLLYSSE